MHRRGFTLLELLVVVVIIGILAALAMPNYERLKENTLDKEAIANLELIRAAEKIYHMEHGGKEYFAGKDGVLNTNLKLALPTTNWNYEVKGDIATATRGGRSCSLSIPGSKGATCSK